MLGSRLFEFHGLASGFQVVGSNPGQPAVVHFLHFCCGLRARCASCVFLFSSKAIDGRLPIGLVQAPRQQVGLERVLRRCTARARTATQTSLFGASGTKAARKLALRAYFERRTLAKTPNATPLGGWSTRRVGCAAKGSYMGYSAK